MSDNAKPSVREAKAGFTAAMEELRPLQSAMETHPLLLLGAAVAVGILAGRSGVKGIRMLTKTGSLAAAALSLPKQSISLLSRFLL